MSISLERFFSPADFESITAAVRESESGTAGEIVPYVVDQSDNYEEALWRGGFAAGMLTLFGLVLMREFTGVWPGLNPTGILLLLVVACGCGTLLAAWIPGLKRFLAGNKLLDKRVAQCASEAFIAEEVFNTRNRSGILIFVSLFEHKVLIVSDAGINAKVEPSAWEEVAQAIVAGMRAGKPGEGLIAAIRKCGALLQKNSLPNLCLFAMISLKS
jgi:putative membrane protein